jgi:general secretion pathway protein M
MTVQGDRVMVQLKNLSASQLANWLAQARSNAQALPDEVHISRSATSSVNSSTSLSASSGGNATNNSTNTTTAWDGQIILRLPQRSTNQASSSVNANASGARP